MQTYYTPCPQKERQVILYYNFTSF